MSNHQEKRAKFDNYPRAWIIDLVGGQHTFYVEGGAKIVIDSITSECLYFSGDLAQERAAKLRNAGFRNALPTRVDWFYLRDRKDLMSFVAPMLK